jgi:hypothetical protein
MKIIVLFVMILVLCFLISQETKAQEKRDSLKWSSFPTLEKPQMILPLKEAALNNKINPILFRKMSYQLEIPAFNYSSSIMHSSSLKWKIPAFAIGIGVALKVIPHFREFDRNIAKSVQDNSHSSFPLDDYLQYAPVTLSFALDAFGIPAKHNLKERLVLSATSYAIMATTVNLLKYTTKVKRPDGSNRHSFPSGHTATAFVGAHLLYKEYKERALWIPLVGYTMAGLTGALRIYNNKHWLSDVVAGAGLGILSVELAYKTLPFWRRVLKLKSHKSFALAPAIQPKSIGVFAALRF